MFFSCDDRVEVLLFCRDGALDDDAAAAPRGGTGLVLRLRTVPLLRLPAMVVRECLDVVVLLEMEPSFQSFINVTISAQRRGT